ncbi:MAG: hypothetical protein MUF72_13750 [Elainella sp. Prado103]|jgi:hypothetical protein|nr:hypothetical protein [Elainella sp. Prado103]
MSLDKEEAKQLLSRIVFGEERPEDWAQDVWGLSPTLGETAAKLIEVFDGLVDCCSEEKLENFLHSLYQDWTEG